MASDIAPFSPSTWVSPAPSDFVTHSPSTRIERLQSTRPRAVSVISVDQLAGPHTASKRSMTSRASIYASGNALSPFLDFRPIRHRTDVPANGADSWFQKSAIKKSSKDVGQAEHNNDGRAERDPGVGFFGHRFPGVMNETRPTFM